MLFIASCYVSRENLEVEETILWFGSEDLELIAEEDFQWVLIKAWL